MSEHESGPYVHRIIQEEPTSHLRFERRVMGPFIKSILVQKWHVVKQCGCGCNAIIRDEEWRPVPEVSNT